MEKDYYLIEDGQLVIRDEHRNVASRNRFDSPVVQIVPLPDNEGCLVLLDPAGIEKNTFENLLRVGLNGEIWWRAELPSDHDAFTRVIVRDSQIEAQTWNGYLVETEPATGQVKNATFVK